MTHAFHPSILRAYDIRGQVDQTLHIEDAYHIGRSFGTIARRRLGDRPHIAVGRDGRLTSPALSESLIAGLASTGCRVADLGLGPTPMTYYATHSYDLAGGIMITGSHNPVDYNGFKLVLGGRSFFGEDIKFLGEVTAQGDYENGPGEVDLIDVRSEYARCVAEGFACEDGQGLSVAWDCGNGAAGAVLAQVLSHLPGQHHVLFEDVDGTFPNHHPDPAVPENLVQLQELVCRKNCDMGIAFDGDGDRCGLIDDEGEVIWADQYLIFLAEEVLASLPAATIIADVKASQVLFDRVRLAGGQALMWKTGHSLIKAKMREIKAPLAGEMSGHVFFADRYFGYDDGLYTAVRIMSHVARSGRKLSDFRKSLPRVFNTPEMRFACEDHRKGHVMAAIKAALSEGHQGEIVEVDGVRCVTEAGWWLLRPSNTEAALVGRVEARSAADQEHLQARLFKLLRQAGVDPSPH